MILFCIKAVIHLNLSERIRLILKENHLKQKEFAKEIGVTESYISAILNGRNNNISMA
ncbi:MAG: helix-turn-helix domain-containing protein, partial [Clostridioides difficile]